MNLRNAVIHILEEAGTPLHAKEITDRIIATGLWTSDGRTPDATVAARLYTDIKTNGDLSPFVKVAPQTFALRGEKSSTTAANTDENGAEISFDLSFLDAAELVLDRLGNFQPMHYREITRQALEAGWLKTSGKTPEATMNAQLVTEIKRARANGESGRFARTSPGCYSLVKWQGTGLPFQISQHNREIREQMLARLHSMPPAQFEELAGQLLAEMGFDSIEVTKASGDGGIDVFGTMVIGDVIRIKMAVQVKRWKNNVQTPTVQQVRGTLGAHEQGLIITTSDFSKGAIVEANHPGKTPVALMNGHQLVTLLMEYNIGVHRVSNDLFYLDDQ